MSQRDGIIRITDLVKQFPDVLAVDRVSLDIRKGEFFALLGPSGCGKSTLLRMIAGLETPTAGTIHIDGQDMSGVPAHQRPVNTVFQHYALFPHLRVRQNIEFGLRYARVPRANYRQIVSSALSLVRLEGLENRWPHELSGGQRQRVALARALVLEPKVLLLDEPLAALDQKLRKQMQEELKSLQRKLGITFVFVTHDQEEALTMSDRIAVMNHARLEQVDDAPRIFERPRTAFVADFMGAANFFAARIVAVDGATVRIEAAAGFHADAPGPACPLRAGQPVRCIVRPEKLDLRSVGCGERVSMPATIESRLYQGLGTTWTLANTAGERFTIYQQNDRPLEEHEFAVGQRAYACFDPRHIVILEEPPDTSPEGTS